MKETNSEKSRIGKLVKNPLFQLIAGIMLLVSVFFEYLTYKHGIMGLLAFHIMQSFFQAIPNILQGLERINKWKK